MANLLPVERLASLEMFGVKLGLQNIRNLLDSLGNPQDTFPSILIAGTNGKGSVGAMVAEILLQHGHRVGHYTSPHLTDVRERICVDRDWISTTEFEDILVNVFSAVDRLVEAGVLPHAATYFETLTAAAFLHFRNRAVNWAVIEVGMGGRYDATNVVQQQLSIITSLDFDHEEYLGSTLTQIATEKAGILKPFGKLATGLLPPEAQQVLLKAVEENSVAWRSVEPSTIADLELVDGFPAFRYAPWQETFHVNLRGKYQAQNAATALVAMDLLGESGVSVNRAIVKKALASVTWPGRLQLQAGSPQILLDSAHNPMGARSLADYLQDIGWNRCVCLFTAMKDKNFRSMLQIVSPHIESLILTRVDPVLRCATLEQLKDAANRAGLQTLEEEDPLQALDLAKRTAIQKGAPLVIFGSMYLIGKLLP